MKPITPEYIQKLADEIWARGTPDPRFTILVHPDVYRYLAEECDLEDVPERFRDHAVALELMIENGDLGFPP